MKQIRLQTMARFFILILLLGGVASCTAAQDGRPRVWIDSPSDGMSFPLGSTVSVLSHVYAREGVAEVVLSVNGEAYRRDVPTSPGTGFVQITQDWQPAAGGIYAIQVVAYDVQGVASSPATITIKIPGAGPTPTSVCPTPVGGGPAPVDCSPPVNACPSPVGGGPTPPSCPTGVPTATDTPTSPPSAQPIIQFWADPAQIQAGACTTIRWHVENVQRVIFGGIDQPFDGSYEDCLCENERYTLTVIRADGTEEKQRVDIDVNGSCVTPTIPPPPQDTTPPPVPSPAVPANGLALSCRSSQTLAWLPVDDPSGIAGYYVKVEVQVTKGNWQSAAGYGPVTGKQVDATVNCGGIYRWMVRAQDGAGNYSGWSAPSSFSIGLN